jgi:hypothetical protein
MQLFAIPQEKQASKIHAAPYEIWSPKSPVSPRDMIIHAHVIHTTAAQIRLPIASRNKKHATKIVVTPSKLNKNEAVVAVVSATPYTTRSVGRRELNSVTANSHGRSPLVIGASILLRFCPHRCRKIA